MRGGRLCWHAAVLLHAAAQDADWHTFAFIGGLQRSGTTWLESKLVSGAPGRVSALSFENVGFGEYERLRPWERTNSTQSYFEMVVRTGGVEGKFVQDVYPYVNLPRDVGTGRRPRHDFELLPARAAAAGSKRLFQQWSMWWNTSRAVLVEKTPENFLMGPFLQAEFGRERTRFVFIVRHPLVWALAIRKWVEGSYVALRTVEERVDAYFYYLGQMGDSLRGLRDAVVLQLETAAVCGELQAAVLGRLSRGTSEPGPSASLRAESADGLAILSSSLAYVCCWLAGAEFSTSLERCVKPRLLIDPPFEMPAELLGLENRWRLERLASRYEGQAGRLGYTFASFSALGRADAPAPELQRLGPELPWMDQTRQVGVASDWRLVGASLRPFLAVPPPLRPSSSVAAAPAAPAALAKRSVLVFYHKMGSDPLHPTGMDLRMSTILRSLVAMRLRVHLACYCDVEPSQLSPFGGVAVYAGSMEAQMRAVLRADPSVSAALLFFTTLTMAVHSRATRGDANWHEEPREALPEERALALLQRLGSGGLCLIAVTDDIHHLRVVQVTARFDRLRAEQAGEWVKRRELAFLGRVSSVVTVSLEDASTLRAAFAAAANGSGTPAAECTRGCVCTVAWVPYVQESVADASVQPFGARRDGMFYVGGKHGLAVAAIEWLVAEVQTALCVLAGTAGDSALREGGKGHLYLAGPGWIDHLQESAAIAAAVSRGHVSLLGTLSDLALAAKLQQYRVFVAPVFNGTGVATKNALAMASGVPLVTTRVGLNGLGLQPGQDAIFATDEPRAFAAFALAAQSDERVFHEHSKTAMAHARTYLSPRYQQQVLCGILACRQADLQPPPAAALSVPGEVVTAESTLRGAASGAAPLVILSLGAEAAALAQRMAPTHCMVESPLAALQRAPPSTQAEHLRTILADPLLCPVRCRLVFGIYLSIHLSICAFSLCRSG